MNKLIAALAIVASACAFAAITDTSVVVSTKGPDKYADGSDVLPGELYALVWFAGDSFGGFKADGTLVNDADKILGYGTATAEKKCGYFKYTLSAEDYAKGGKFGVYLLDTRVFADEAAPVLAEKKDGAPTVVNETSLMDAVVDVAAAATGVQGKEAGEFAATALPAGSAEAKIVGIDIVGAEARIKVATSEYGRFDVASGEAPDALAADNAAPKSANGGTITIVKPITGKSGFFKLIRK